MTAPPTLRCPYCRDDAVPSEEPLVACALCSTALHASCALAHGRCTTLACPGSFGPSSETIARRSLAFVAPAPSLARELAALPWQLVGALGALVALAAGSLSAWLS